MRFRLFGSIAALLLTGLGLNAVKGPDQDVRTPVAAPPFSANDVVDEFVLGNLGTKMVSADWLPDGRLIGIKQTGEVLLMSPNGPGGASSVSLFFVPGVTSAGELGLLDVAVSPTFLTDNQFYLYYSHTSARLRISRFTLSSSIGSVVLATQQLIWESPGSAIAANYHIGGSLNFGTDGMMYLTVGDNLTPANSQSLLNVFGKVLRMTPAGAPAPGNPFADGAGPQIDEIWAYGLRNPFRSSFDSVTGKMWIGDVGGNVANTAYEEVNIAVGGANYGWPSCEGPLGLPKNGPVCPGGITAPIHSYSHDFGASCCENRAITGGEVYRGSHFPGLNGLYVYADYPTGKFFWVEENGTGGSTSGSFRDSGLVGADPVWLSVSPFDGQIYWMNYDWQNSAQLRRMRFSQTGQQPPSIFEASATPDSGAAPLTVQFTGDASDPNGDLVTYFWTFGDGTTSTLQSPVKTYTSIGAFTATLSVTAGPDTVTAQSILISVGSPPVPVIGAPPAGTTFSAGDTLLVTGTATNSSGATLPPANLSWEVRFLHEQHGHPIATGTGSNITIPILRTGHGWEGQTAVQVTLTAVDSAGLTGSVSRVFQPNRSTVTIQSNVPGLVEVDGISHSLPFGLDTILGFQHTISVPATACAGGRLYSFASWSDGGIRSHQIEIAAQSQLTATFSDIGECASLAVNLNGASVTVNGTPFAAESGTPAVTAGPYRFCNQSVALLPATSSEESEMLRCSVWGTDTSPAFVDVTGLDNGQYGLSLWMWEDSVEQTVGVTANGQTVVPATPTGAAGTWSKRGPFTVTVTNGQVNVDTFGGDANISAIRLDAIPGSTTTTTSTTSTTTTSTSSTTSTTIGGGSTSTTTSTTAPSTTTAPPTTATPLPVSGDLFVSPASNRANGSILRNAILTPGTNTYVYFAATVPVTRVRFFIDRPATGTPNQNEGAAPWDLAGGSTNVAQPAVWLPGTHVVNALVTLATGQTEVVSATFQASSGAISTTSTSTTTTLAGPTTSTTTTTTLPGPTTSTTTIPPSSIDSIRLSLSPSRLGHVGLDGTTLAPTQLAYIFVAPRAGITRVQFFLDQMSGTPIHTENSAPWDFVGGNTTTATAFPISNLVPGSHFVRAVIRNSDGSLVTVISSFNRST